MTKDLPFTLKEFRNASGTVSYRVAGFAKGERIRRNFAQHASALAFCNEKNAEALRAAVAPARTITVLGTELSEKEVRMIERAKHRIDGHWQLAEVIEEGIKALESRVKPEPVTALAEAWLEIIEGQVSPRWYSDLKHRVTLFVGAHTTLTTDKLTRATVRAWLDGLPHAQQSKANMRNAVHRFGGWLVERGYVRENPAADIRIARRRSGAQIADRPLPSIFTPIQCEALLRACEMGACRRLLGWMATCLFTGLRPDSEAPRATWAEVNLETGEWSVMGRKRGAKPRVIPLQPAALTWLRAVKADKMEKPALYSRKAKIRAIELANEWLAEHHPEAPRIAWSNDVTRHTFASYRSPQIAVHKLAEELGNSAATIYGHYRHPRPAAEVKAFWAIMPAR